MDTASVLRSIGVENTGQISTAPNYNFDYVLEFTSLAAGAEVTVSKQIERSSIFIVDQITGSATNDAAAGTGTTITALVNANGTSDGTIADVTATPTQTLINNNFRDVTDKINEIITALGTNAQFPAKHQLSIQPIAGVASYAAVDVQFYSTRGNWQSTWKPWPSAVGTAQNPYVPLYKHVLASGSELGVRIRNRTAVTISGSITLAGRNIAASSRG
jgi:hypothetical protein